MGYAWKCLGLAVGLHEDFAYFRTIGSGDGRGGKGIEWSGRWVEETKREGSVVGKI